MPTDYRRINGPENSVPYRLYSRLNTKSFEEQLKEAIDPEGVRSDKRKLLEHRKIFVKSNAVSQAKGSAYLEIGETKVIVSVFDPREIPNKTDYCQKGELYCEFKYATFSCPQRRMFQQDVEEKQNSLILKQALEPAVCLHEFPNFQVDVYVLVLENNGSALSAAITAASIALSNAGVLMYDLVTASTLGIVNDTFLLDPTLKEEQLCSVGAYDKNQDCKDHGLIIIANLNTHQQITQFHQSGKIQYENVEKSMQILSEANKDIVPLVEKCIVKFVMQSLNKNED